MGLNRRLFTPMQICWIFVFGLELVMILRGVVNSSTLDLIVILGSIIQDVVLLLDPKQI